LISQSRGLGDVYKRQPKGLVMTDALRNVSDQVALCMEITPIPKEISIDQCNCTCMCRVHVSLQALGWEAGADPVNYTGTSKPTELRF
jgi:hypothetical protein